MFVHAPLWNVWALAIHIKTLNIRIFKKAIECLNTPYTKSREKSGKEESFNEAVKDSPYQRPDLAFQVLQAHIVALRSLLVVPVRPAPHARLAVGLGTQGVDHRGVLIRFFLLTFVALGTGAFLGWIGRESGSRQAAVLWKSWGVSPVSHRRLPGRWSMRPVPATLDLCPLRAGLDAWGCNDPPFHSRLRARTCPLPNMMMNSC